MPMPVTERSINTMKIHSNAVVWACWKGVHPPEKLKLANDCWLLKSYWSIITCLHFNIKRSWSKMGVNYASSTLMLKIVILKSVSKPMERRIRSHGDGFTSRWLEDAQLWMMHMKQQQKDHPTFQQVIKRSLRFILLKDGVKKLNKDDQSKTTSRDHPTQLHTSSRVYYRLHKVIEESTYSSYKEMLDVNA